LFAETNFRRAMENSILTGMRALDLEGRITYVNLAFCQMTGWQENELIGAVAPYPYWPDEDRDFLMARLEEELSGNQTSGGFQVRVKRKNGSIFDARLYVSPLIDANGQQTGWMTSMTDITEPNRVREQLAASYERFTIVLEALDASVSVAPLGSEELLFANKLYRQWFSNDTHGHLNLVEKAGMLDIRTSETEMDDVDALAGLPTESLTVAPAERAEIYLEHLDKWLEIRTRYINWADGRLAQLVIATDITARRQAEELATQQAERAQNASRLITMGEMASSLAHELNQPLSAISNYCMGIAKRLSGTNSPLSVELLPALQKASDQAHRAGTIIQRIRGFVKRSEPQSKPSNITDIVADSVGLVELEANRHRLKIVSEVASDIPLVDLDPVLIQQVLVNLLKNSLDSLREVYPLSSRWSAPPVRITADLETSTFPSMLRIQVTDTGAGIAESVISRMFEPFFSTKEDGMGMGLNICRSIIESHHGRLWAKNHMDTEHTRLVGCTFTILLPLESSHISKSSIGNTNESKQSPENSPS
jgi:PAS domain S-box-containing protein